MLVSGWAALRLDGSMDRWVDEMDDGSVIRIPWSGMAAFFLVSREKALPARLGSAMERSVESWMHGWMDA